VSKVHQENQAKENKGSGADESDVVAPEHEEVIWNEEGYDDKDEPE
jgi:hypothetical protein